jgi:hypothetical protein
MWVRLAAQRCHVQGSGLYRFWTGHLPLEFVHLALEPLYRALEVLQV